MGTLSPGAVAMTWWKGLILGVLFLAVAGDHRPAGSRTGRRRRVEVQIAKAKKGAITRTVAGAGKVQAATTVKISSNLSGDLIELRGEGRATGDQGPGARPHRPAPLRGRGEAGPGRAERGPGGRPGGPGGGRPHHRGARPRGGAGRARGWPPPRSWSRPARPRDTAVARLGSAQQRLAQATAAYDAGGQQPGEDDARLPPSTATSSSCRREVGERVRGWTSARTW